MNVEGWVKFIPCLDMGWMSLTWIFFMSRSGSSRSHPPTSTFKISHYFFFAETKRYLLKTIITNICTASILCKSYHTFLSTFLRYYVNCIKFYLNENKYCIFIIILWFIIHNNYLIPMKVHKMKSTKELYLIKIQGLKL